MALFTAFPAQERSGNERELAQVYLMAVEDLPDEAVSNAVKRFIKGEALRDVHTFRPSPPELAQEARRGVRTSETDLDKALRRARKFMALEAPERPPASERAVIVKNALGYNPLQKPRIPQVHRNGSE